MTKILLPQRKNEWRTPSQAQPKDFAGNENQTRFRLTARYHDGAVAWRGWFDDRDEADAFLFAMASGTLHVEPELWRMPTPAWDPYLDVDLVYEFVTTTFIVTPGAGTYSVPSDWDQFNNSVGVIAGGSSGATGSAVPGGNGGGYSAVTNLTIFGSISVSVGAAGGGSTWFNGASAGAATVSATNGTNTGNGTTKYNGGSGAGGGASGRSGGGGGAAGPNGNGVAGSNSGGTGIGGPGGAGDAGFGGAGGGGSGQVGGNGTEFDATHGCGGGGTGGQGGSAGAAGGFYGGGGGGGGGGGPGGVGRQGLIVVTYTPVSIFSFNLAMNGM